jgi:hypothetical protein
MTIKTRVRAILASCTRKNEIVERLRAEADKIEAGEDEYPDVWG